MRELTKGEEQIMQILWDRGPCFVRDILETLPEPKPAYNTVSTIVRILESKGFAGHKAFGKSHRYHAAISREDYLKFSTAEMLKGYFGGSASRLVSFFIKQKKLDLNDLNTILEELNKPQKP